ncbi:MAG: hypothetical protein ABIP75_01120 [Pyrinomonadaceae bacterium]
MNNLLIIAGAVLAFGSFVLFGPGSATRPDVPGPETECAPSPVASTFNRLSGQETTVTGTPEAEGWQRFEPLAGVSFMLPGSAKLKLRPQKTEIGTLERKIYTYESPRHMFAIEVVDGYRIKGAKIDRSEVETKLIKILEENLEQRAYNLNPAKLITDASPSRRDYSFFIADTYVNGEARIYFTPTRAVVVIAMRKGRDVDEGPVTRFLESVRVGETAGVGTRVTGSGKDRGHEFSRIGNYEFP